MGGPTASGAVGPELPDVVVLEVGVDEGPQGRPLGADGARWRCRAGGTGGGGRAGCGCLCRSLLIRRAVTLGR